MDANTGQERMKISADVEELVRSLEEVDAVTRALQQHAGMKDLADRLDAASAVILASLIDLFAEIERMRLEQTGEEPESAL